MKKRDQTKTFVNNKNVISFVANTLSRPMKGALSERKTLEKDLLFYIRFYSKVDARTQIEFDYQIQQTIERLKELSTLKKSR